MRLLFMTALAASMLTVSSASRAEQKATSVDADLPVTIDDTYQIDFTSQINGESYRIQIYKPHIAGLRGGLPVVYVLDGNALFGTFANAVRNRGQAGEIAPAVVVGVASGDGPHRAERTLDFTTYDLTAREKRIIKDIEPGAPFGGSERFLKVLQEEIAPRVAQVAAVDASKSTLVGWSLGGLFVTHTMLVHPEAFSTYVALSPSLWRSGGAVFGEIGPFQRKLAAGQLAPSLFVGVSSGEGDPNSAPARGWSKRDWAEEIRYAAMESNAVRLAAVLRPTMNTRLRSEVFQGETHNSVPWTAVNPILNFALPAASTAPGS